MFLSLPLPPKAPIYSAGEIRAVAAQVRADGDIWMPFLGERISVSDWEFRELARIAASHAPDTDSA